MPDSTEFRWIPSRGIPSRLYPVIGVAVVLLAIVLGESVWLFGPDAVLQALLLSPKGNGWLLPFLLYYVFASMTLTSVLLVFRNATSRIGIGASGVRVVCRLRTRDFPWESLRPGIAPPSGKWAAFNAGFSTWTGLRYFWVSIDQARAILTDPKAPRALFPPEYWSWIGVPQSIGGV
jgi:hypothetical protein